MSRFINEIFIENFLDQGDLKLKLKQVTVIVGNNGSGKTTLLKIVKDILNFNTKNYYFDLFNKAILSIKDKNDYKIVCESFSNDSNLKKIISEIISNESFKENLSSHIKENKNVIYSHKENEVFLSSEKSEDSKYKVKYNNEHEELILKILSKRKEKFCKYIVSTPTDADKIKNIHIENILNSALNANSQSLTLRSDGEYGSVLDFEINEILNDLTNSENYEELISLLICSINKFFSHNQIESFFDKTLKFRLKNNGKIIDFDKLSSGERQLVYIFLKVIRSKHKKSVILMDEPEISLHLNWQENLIDEIVILNSDAQIIIVTHSPAIVMKGWINSYIDMKNIIETSI
jgi:ABC-type lipoprotein export system ATPase subunit